MLIISYLYKFVRHKLSDSFNKLLWGSLFTSTESHKKSDFVTKNSLSKKKFTVFSQ